MRLFDYTPLKANMEADCLLLGKGSKHRTKPPVVGVPYEDIIPCPAGSGKKHVGYQPPSYPSWASCTWRPSLGSPILNMVHVILVVTRNQHPGGVGGVCQSRQSPGLLDTPKNRRTWVFDGTKTASLCQIWPEKLISLLQVSKKESKLNFWICYFLGISKICCFEMVCHWYNVDFFRQMLFSETQKFSSWCDMNFPRCSGSRSRSVVPGSWNPETQTGCSMTASEPCAMQRPAKSFGGSPRGIAYAAYFSCRPRNW